MLAADDSWRGGIGARPRAGMRRLEVDSQNGPPADADGDISVLLRVTTDAFLGL